MKHVFTHKQAASILSQINNGIKDVDIMMDIDSKNKFLKLTNDQLYEKLIRVMDEETIAGVVDD